MKGYLLEERCSFSSVQRLRKSKKNWTCSGGSWWDNKLIRHFMLVFPLICHLYAYSTLTTTLNTYVLHYSHIFCAIHRCKTPSTHRAAIPQWPPDFFPASMNSDRPMRLMVGAIARGPMYFSTRPTSPEKPRKIWSREATRMAPWICWWQGKRDTTEIHMPSFWYSTVHHVA